MAEYDIFISYRRVGGADFARQMQLALKNKGYSVFLDFDELKDGVFDRRIEAAIKSSKVFLFILSTHALDRCKNDGDWVRLEIECALVSQCHIVPVNPNAMFQGFDDNLPYVIKNGLGQYQISTVMMNDLFELTFNEFVQHRIAPIVSPTKKTTHNDPTIEVHIKTDIACRVMRFNDVLITAQPNIDNLVHLKKGSHELTFVSLDNKQDNYSQVYTVKDDCEFLQVSLAKIRDARLAKEKAERKRITLEDAKHDEFGEYGNKTEDYDIFISCKSEDYEIAEKVYSFLNVNGFRVFLSSKELRRMAQADYMDAISVVLDTAYSMIVISTKKEYLKSKWVKFEWSTFLNEILSGRKNGQIMTLLENIKVSEMPIQLRKYESFTLENYKDILPYLEKPKKQEENHETDAAELHIKTDTPCRVLRFNKELMTAQPDDDNLIHLKKGSHVLKFVSLENEQDNYSQVYTIRDDCDILQVNLTIIRDARLAKEEAKRRAQEEKQNTFDAKNGAAEVHVETDIACRVMRFKEELITAVPDDDNLIHLKKGTHKLTFVSLENEQDTYSQVFTVKDDCEFMQVSLTKIRDTRLAKEEDERKRVAQEEVERKRLAQDDAKYKYFEANGRCGFKKDGVVVIPAKNDYAMDFREGLAKVVLDGKWGYIDKSGKEVIPFKYDDAMSFSEGLAGGNLNGKWGYIDKTGKAVIPFKYDYAESFSEGFAAVYLKGKWGYIDKTGVEVIPFRYEEVWSFSKGLAVIKLNGKYGFIDKSGKEVIPIKYDYVEDFENGKAMVRLNGKCGFIDKSGKEVIPFKYEYALPFSDGLARVKLNGKYGYIDKSGNEVTPFKYDDAWSFSEGLAAVELNYKWGYIDQTGKAVIPFKYDSAESFSEGLAKVRLYGKWGFIDTAGKEVIPIKLDYASSFREGLAVVALNGKYGYIDKSGKEVIPFKYDCAWSFNNGKASVELDGEWGTIDKQGNFTPDNKW